MRCGVVLAGCGTEDGTAVDEAIITFLSLEKAGAEIFCVALDKDQYEVFNHQTRKSAELEQKRNQLTESARLLNGLVSEIEDVCEDDLDLLLIPGGKGVLNSLSTFEDEEEQFRVNNGLQRLLVNCFKKRKPLGAAGEGVFILAKSLENVAANLMVTASGNPSRRLSVVEKLAIDHVPCEEGEVCVDKTNRIVTAPLLSRFKNLAEKKVNIEKLVEKLLEMVY
ncbi:DJ-1/PfpI family protein [Mesotoga sp. BH458_6_3_2_1]|uniref:DJ-1/PfpI family protein n=1 Tax=Mesotoga sp. BH458_6_3_2_1 TaxID=1437446 RepID=UPI000EF2429B|nr:DJ-1/PfpI family protein [Mesotoga sp. BH458_6_3_2_1]RLL82949.1 thiamine biosynthesis protein ThiJ [Mesotoga sp. BH458_6_3_2_1]